MNGGGSGVAAVVVITVFGLVLHGAWVFDVLVAWGFIQGGTISEAVHGMLVNRPGVALLLGFLVCHLIRG